MAGCASSCATFRSGRLRHPCRIGAAARPVPLDATRIAAACDGRRRAPGRSRTGDAHLRKVALYPLSYGGVCVPSWRGARAGRFVKVGALRARAFDGSRTRFPAVGVIRGFRDPLASGFEGVPRRRWGVPLRRRVNPEKEMEENGQAHPLAGSTRSGRFSGPSIVHAAGVEPAVCTPLSGGCRSYRGVARDGHGFGISTPVPACQEDDLAAPAPRLFRGLHAGCGMSQGSRRNPPLFRWRSLCRGAPLLLQQECGAHVPERGDVLWLRFGGPAGVAPASRRFSRGVLPFFCARVRVPGGVGVFDAVDRVSALMFVVAVRFSKDAGCTVGAVSAYPGSPCLCELNQSIT